MHWEKRPDKHVKFEGTDRINVPDSSSLHTTEWTWVSYGDWPFYNGDLYKRVITKREPGTVEYQIAFNTGSEFDIIDSSGGHRYIMANWPGSKSVIITAANGVKAKAYLDGSYVAETSAVLSLSSTNKYITIGNRYDGVPVFGYPLKGVLIYNTVLTADEITQVHKWIYQRNQI